MPTTADLGVRVKQKYPGAYDDLSDIEVGQKVKTKYPGSYDDFTDVQGQEVLPQEEETGFLQSVARGIVNPIRRTVATAESALRGGAGLGQYLTGKAFGSQRLAQKGKEQIRKAQEVTYGDTPYLGEATNVKSPREAVGLGTQVAGMFTGNPAIAGGFLAGGKALEEGAGPAETVGKTALGFGLGHVSGKLIDYVGRGLGKLGDRITQSVIKPSQADIKDGFNIANIQKYNLGGSLKKTFSKTESTMDDLTKQLNQKLAASKETIDLQSVYSSTQKALSGSRLTGFGANTSRTKALQQLQDEIIATQPTDKLVKNFIENVTAQLRYTGKNELADKIISVIKPEVVGSFDDLVKGVTSIPGALDDTAVKNWLGTVQQEFGNPILSVPEANIIKRAAGHFGAWQYGMRDPESTAREAVYNEFYKQMKVAIEKASPEVKDINKSLSELIPIMNAVIRRIPVAERGNVINLTDVINLIGSTFNPSALGVLTATRLGTSGTFGNILSKSSRAITPKLSSFAGKVSGVATQRFNRNKSKQGTTQQE